MRLFISKAVALGLCVSALVACGPQDSSAPAVAGRATTNSNATAAQQATKPAPAQSTADETRRIGLEEARAAADSGKALIVDVRDEAAFKTSHIKGAKSFPLPQFNERIGELPKDKLIITYCA